MQIYKSWDHTDTQHHSGKRHKLTPSVEQTLVQKVQLNPQDKNGTGEGVGIGMYSHH